MKKLTISFTYLLLAFLCVAENTIHNHNSGGYTNSQLAKKPGGPAPTEYVPNEIIVKFSRNIANVIEMKIAEDAPLSELKLSDSLDKLHKKYRVTEIRAVFKNFTKKRQQIEALLKKDKTLLTKRERRILRRLRRAPKGAKVPDLNRIYKVEVELERGQSLEEVVAAYNSNPDVEYAELNYIVSIDLTPNDPHYPIQWPLNNTGQMYPESGNYNHPPGTPDCDIDAPEAWDINTGSSEVIVAVADTGVDYTHRDIDDNMWTDPNGYHGYDFVNLDNYPIDDHGHGTHCAGIIAAEGNNGLDIAGVCWNVKIMALKFLDGNGSGNYADAAEAFYYAVNNGADIISNSWGKDDFSQTMQDAIDYAHSQGVVIVASAGNDNQYYFPHYPAFMEHVISVAATNSNDEKAPISNYGDWIDISAPGIDILSLRANGTSMGTIYDGYTTVASGTSMSCPHVAGVLGLLLSTYPDISSEEIMARLFETADDITAQNPYYEGKLGSGRVNAHKALRFCFEGIIKLDEGSYSCSDVVRIEVQDFDIRGSGTCESILTTDGGDYETLILTEEPNQPWIFGGTIPTSDSPVIAEDGYSQVSHGQTIIAEYNDPNFGASGPMTVEANATIDCCVPVISDIEVSDITSSGARVKFKTDEPTTGRVRCGLACGGPYDIVREDKALEITHDIYLPGLNSQIDYYFVIDANDVSGNQITNTNSGQCYTFSTKEIPEGLHVPSEYPTIQAAINNAVNGDTIWVADGIYTGPGNRHIRFADRSITVRSENGPVACIIDCEKVCRAFTFDSGEDPNAVIMGFTIQNGSANGSVWKDQIGGAILCYNSSPTINNCIFIGNDAKSYGGGILLGDLSRFSHSVVNNCIFQGNSAHTGGGIHCGKGNQTITNCKLIGNLATYDYGGGICCWQDSYARIENCQFKNNASWKNNRGGAISCMIAYPLIKNCLFIDNFAMGNYYGGGGIFANHTNATIENCTFYGNTTTKDGGACHFSGNKDINVKNCILFNNYPNQIYRYMTAGRVYVSYSDVQHGYSGTGNINVDPYFANPLNDDFHLKSKGGRWEPSSKSWVYDNILNPCIDVGNPNSDWTAELWPHGKRINMGAYGGTPQASMSLSDVGNIADLDNDDIVNFIDFAHFGDSWQIEEFLKPEDLNRNGFVDIFDLAIFADNWCWQ